MSFGEADSKAARKKLDDKQAEEDAATILPRLVRRCNVTEAYRTNVTVA